MKITRAYQFRLYPTAEQEILIHKTFGCTRFLYNQMLDEKKKNVTLSKFDLFKKIPEYIEKYPFLSEVDSCSLRSSITDLMGGYERFLNKNGCYPKYQKRGIKKSYRTNCTRSTYKGKEYATIQVDLQGKYITLPKLKKVKIRGYRCLDKLPGKILNATIKQVGYKYYVSVCVEEEKEEVIYTEQRAIGIDIGIKHMVVTSDKTYYENPEFLKKYERRIQGYQQELSRREKGSKNYEKTLRKLEELYRKLKNARKKYLEEVVSKIMKKKEIIIAEKLKVKEMLCKDNNPKSVRKNISNVMFQKILQTLEYKCKWSSKTFHQISTYYPSSQICSECGYKDSAMKDYGIRKYECPVCGIQLERDYNASRNILEEGLRELSLV